MEKSSLVTILVIYVAAFSEASTIPSYDWLDDGSDDSPDVYRTLTSDNGLARSTSLNSNTATLVESQGTAGTGVKNGYPTTQQGELRSTLSTDNTDTEYSLGDTDDKIDDDRGGTDFSIDNLSEEKRRILTEILSSVYEDDALDLDVLRPTKTSDDSDYGGNDEKSSDDKAEEIIADILTTGSTDPSGTRPSSTAAAGISVMDLTYRQYQKSIRAFAEAETEALEAELAFTDAEAVLSTAASQAVAKASEAARALAVSTIAAARAEARSTVLASRQKYVSAVVDAHGKISLMRAAERRLNNLMVTFAKARTYAGASILGVKKCAGDLAAAKAERSDYEDYSRAYNTAVATAKTRVGKMKVVEKRVFLMAKALAKARAEAFACKLKVRKMGYSCAKTCAVASVKVNDAISSATTNVSRAIDLASATSSAKAESVLEAANKAKALSQARVQRARLAVAKAKAQVEAVAAAQTTTATAVAAASAKANSITLDDDDDDDGYSASIGTLSSAPAISDVQIAVQSASVSSAGTDATDTKAYY